MKITLHPIEPPPGHEDVTFVGTLDGYPFGLRDRRPVVCAFGRCIELDQSEIGGILYEAIEHAATRLFGGDWKGSLSLVSGMAPRSVAGGRILTHGLPAPVLEMLACFQGETAGRTMGALMRTAAFALGRPEQPLPADPDAFESLIAQKIRPALEAVLKVRHARQEYLASLAEREETPVDEGSPAMAP